MYPLKYCCLAVTVYAIGPPRDNHEASHTTESRKKVIRNNISDGLRNSGAIVKIVWESPIRNVARARIPFSCDICRPTSCLSVRACSSYTPCHGAKCTKHSKQAKHGALASSCKAYPLKGNLVDANPFTTGLRTVLTHFCT